MFTQLEGAAWIAFDKLLIPDKVEVSGSELFARVHGAGDKWALGDIRHYWVRAPLRMLVEDDLSR